MLRWSPFEHALRRALRLPAPGFEAGAVERWTIAPGRRRHAPPGRFLPGQMDRIKGTEFGDAAAVVHDLKGDFEAEDGPTLGLRHRHVDLVDGVLYGPTARQPLRERRHRHQLAFRRPTEVRSGALPETWIGNRWFGSWLGVDCLSYPLAAPFGTPLTTRPPPQGHRAEYEALLGQNPAVVHEVHFDELITFNDDAHNQHKQARAVAMRRQLIAALGQPVVEHPGVFLWRGHAGDRRFLNNEAAVAEHLAARRGFTVVDPLKLTVRELVRVCAGARVVAGVEGSQLCHGLAAMAPRSALLVIQPPTRVVSVLKNYTDRQEQVFAFVVGEGNAEQFSIDVSDVDRTLELALA